MACIQSCCQIQDRDSRSGRRGGGQTGLHACLHIRTEEAEDQGLLKLQPTKQLTGA